MKLERTRVNYTEVKVTMMADEVREALAEYIKNTKNIDIHPADIEFDIETYAKTGEDVAFMGITAIVLKRGRASRKDKEKEKTVEQIADVPAVAAIDEILKGEKIPKPGKKVRKKPADKLVTEDNDEE